jgi:hypothetical protein
MRTGGHPVAGHGVCADPVVRGFHLTAAESMLDAGMLRLYLLRMGNSIAAAYYGFAVKRTAYAYLSGFDPEFAELSPGTQIVAHAIEEAVRWAPTNSISCAAAKPTNTPGAPSTRPNTPSH